MSKSEIDKLWELRSKRKEELSRRSKLIRDSITQNSNSHTFSDGDRRRIYGPDKHNKDRFYSEFLDYLNPSKSYRKFLKQWELRGDHSTIRYKGELLENIEKGQWNIAEGLLNLINIKKNQYKIEEAQHEYCELTNCSKETRKNYCPDCNTKNNKKAVFCCACGKKLKSGKPQARLVPL